MEGVEIRYGCSVLGVYSKVTRAAGNDVLTFLFWVEWEPRPSSPSLIRLISFGKLLDDKAPLSGE